MSHLLQRLIARARAPASLVMPLLTPAYARSQEAGTEGGISDDPRPEPVPADLPRVSDRAERVAVPSQNDAEDATEIENSDRPAVLTAGAARRPALAGAPRPLSIEPIVHSPTTTSVPSQPSLPARPSPRPFRHGPPVRSPDMPEAMPPAPQRPSTRLEGSRPTREEPPASAESPSDRTPAQPPTAREPVVLALPPDIRHPFAATRPGDAAQRNGSGPEQAAPIEVTVSIGHIEVRSAPSLPPPRPTPSRPRLTLDDFLNRRHGGKDR